MNKEYKDPESQKIVEVEMTDAEQNKIIVKAAIIPNISDEDFCGLIENHIIDINMKRILGCIFITKSRRIAKDFCNILVNNLGYNVDVPYLSRGFWVINTYKLITISELKDTIKIATEESEKSSCLLSDYFVATDMLPKN